jgi:hypothetical protein
MNMSHNSVDRMAWLEAGKDFLAERIFNPAGYSVPENIRISFGWPRRSQNAIGQCWGAESSRDGQYEIFVTPALDRTDSARILDILAHEMVHAVVGLECSHKGAFRTCAHAIGLEGKMTATVAGATLKKTLDAYVAGVGPCPHGALSAMTKAGKQGTRLLKAVCPTCGYTVRITKKWVNEAGAPYCGIKSHGRMEMDNG